MIWICAGRIAAAARIFCCKSIVCVCARYRLFFFFNDTATTEIYTLSLPDALPIFEQELLPDSLRGRRYYRPTDRGQDRKSTRLNSSHVSISYAVFCLKKKNTY